MHIFPMRIKFIRIIEANVKTNFSKDLTKLFNENLRIGEEFFETQNADFLRIMRLKRNYLILIKKVCITGQRPVVLENLAVPEYGFRRKSSAWWQHNFHLILHIPCSLARGMCLLHNTLLVLPRFGYMATSDGQQNFSKKVATPCALCR